MKYLFYPILTLFLLCPLQTASAQGAPESQIFLPPATEWDNNAAKQTQILQQQSLLQESDKLSVNEVEVSIEHPDYLEPHQFTLVMKLKNAETGCHNYSPIDFESKIIEPHFMDITLNFYRRNFKETQYPTFDCDQSNKIVSTMMVLDAKDLKKRGLRQLRFSNGAARDQYNIVHLENKIRLEPQSMVAFKAKGLTGPDKAYMEYDYGDQSIVALQVPMALESDNITQAVRDLAYKQAFQPILGDNAMKSDKKNVFYFKAPNASTVEDLKKTGYMEFGTIQVMRPYDGAQGRVGLPVPLKVFISQPNKML